MEFKFGKSLWINDPGSSDHGEHNVMIRVSYPVIRICNGNGAVRDLHEKRLSETPLKRKLKKTLKGWVNVYDCIDPTIQCSQVYPDENYARVSAGQGLIACVYVSGNYEVEE